MIILWAILASSLPLPAQQKGQYVPGQFGLNAGILPGPGFIYVNMESNCDTSTLNDGKRNALPAKPSLNLLAIENIFYYVPDTMFLGGNLGFAILVPTIANGSLTLAQLNISGTTWGLADTWVQPFTAGWHLKRADIQVGDAIITPTGRYSQSSLSVNISANCSRSERSAMTNGRLRTTAAHLRSLVLSATPSFCPQTLCPTTRYMRLVGRSISSCLQETLLCCSNMNTSTRPIRTFSATHLCSVVPGRCAFRNPAPQETDELHAGHNCSTQAIYPIPSRGVMT